MSVKNSATRYGSAAQLLHWLIAALIVTQFVLGQLAERAGEAASPVTQLGLLANHKSIGMTILALAIVRLIWRFLSPPPALPTAMPDWQRTASHVSHWLLYFFLFALPISGWLMSSAAAFTVSWFGLFEFPNLIGAREELSDALKGVHHFLATVLSIVAIAHIAAALKHHFFDKDDVLRRMSSPASLSVFAIIAVSATWLSSDIGTTRESAAAPTAAAEAVIAGAKTPAPDPSLPLWVVDYGASTIGFTGKQAGGEFDGIWKSWQAELRFDKANLAASDFLVTVDIASVDTESADRDQTMMNADWFDQANYPTALFATEQIQANADGSYTANALLTIKDKATRISFDFTVREEAGRQLLEGTSTVLDGGSLLDRLALSLGTGDWAATDEVGQFVEVQVHVEATVPDR